MFFRSPPKSPASDLARQESLQTARVPTGISQASSRRSRSLHSQPPLRNAFTPLVREQSELSQRRHEHSLEKKWAVLGTRPLESDFSASETASLRSRSLSVESRLIGQRRQEQRGTSLERRQQYDRKRWLRSGIGAKKKKESQHEAKRWAIYCNIRDAMQGDGPELGIMDGQFAQRPAEPASPGAQEELDKYEQQLLKGLRSKSNDLSHPTSLQYRGNRRRERPISPDVPETAKRGYRVDFAQQEQQKGRQWSTSPIHRRLPEPEEKKHSTKKKKADVAKPPAKKAKPQKPAQRQPCRQSAAGDSTPTASTAPSPRAVSVDKSAKPAAAAKKAPPGAKAAKLPRGPAAGTPTRGRKLHAEVDQPVTRKIVRSPPPKTYDTSVVPVVAEV
ncbi:hypothetical protein DIPPA_31925 [Diplonema papillatum]|nr:hypothetical protein DIPPA_31925 [Diplonema papillatum]